MGTPGVERDDLGLDELCGINKLSKTGERAAALAFRDCILAYYADPEGQPVPDPSTDQSTKDLSPKRQRHVAYQALACVNQQDKGHCMLVNSGLIDPPVRQ